MDKYCDTCTSGGVKVSGLHATSAPRRHDNQQPILEKYSFIPYIEMEQVEISDNLKLYANACKAVAYNVIKEKLSNSCAGSDNKDILAEVVKQCDVEHTLDDIADFMLDEGTCTFLPFMKGLTVVKNENCTDSAVNCNMFDREQCFKSDCLLNILKQAVYLKPSLDIVVENTMSNSVKILEVKDTGMADIVLPLLTKNPLLHPAYTIATNDQNGESLEQEEINVVNWSPSQEVPNSFTKSDLTILNNVLHNESNINAGLKNILHTVSENGFILVFEITKNFHLALPLDNFDGKTSKYDDLTARSCSIYCTAEKWREIFSQHGLEIIFERSEPVLSSMFLLRKQVPNFNVEQQSVVNVTDATCNWVEELKEKMSDIASKPKGQNLWLVTKASTCGIVGLVNCLRQEPGGEKIRLVSYFRVFFFN